MGHGLLRFTAKEKPPHGEEVGHPWLTLLAWINGICSYYFKLYNSGYALAQHSIPLLSAGTILVPLFWSRRYLSREEALMRTVILWFISFAGALHESLFWRGLGVTLSGLAFLILISPISIIMPWCIPSTISTHHWVGPRKSVSNRAPHLLMPALGDGNNN